MMVTVSGRRPSRTAVDWLLCLLTALLTASGSVDRLVGWMPHATIVPLAACQGLFLLPRRRAPLASLTATTLLAAFMISVGCAAGAAGFGVYGAAYAVAVYAGDGEGAERAQALRGASAAAASAAVIMVASTTPGSRSLPVSWGTAVLGLLVASAWILGYAIRTRRAYIAELKDRAARLEAAQGERAARAVADERLRIARELHDVIGHSITLVTIQAEAAARSLRTDPDAVPGFLATISATSREALAEMRHVLAVLRPDARAELSPQPGLDGLADLVARLNAGGLRTRLDLEPLELPPGIGLAVYRIVQEALTNVLKHAGTGARAGVTVARCAGSVRVSVHDDGAGPKGPVSSAAHGIVGMRERAGVYGGTLRTGAGPTGGFEVEAWIPLPEEVP